MGLNQAFNQAIAEGRSAVRSLRLLIAYADRVKDVDQRGQLMRIACQLSLQIAETQLSLLEEFVKNPEIKEIPKILID